MARKINLDVAVRLDFTHDGKDYAGQFWAFGDEPCSLWVVPFNDEPNLPALDDDYLLVYELPAGGLTTDQAAALDARRGERNRELVTAELF